MSVAKHWIVASTAPEMYHTESDVTGLLSTQATSVTNELQGPNNTTAGRSATPTTVTVVRLAVKDNAPSFAWRYRAGRHKVSRSYRVVRHGAEMPTSSSCFRHHRRTQG